MRDWPTFTGMLTSSNLRFRPWSFFFAALATAAVGCSSNPSQSPSQGNQNSGLSGSPECAGKSCGADCSPAGSDDPLKCNAAGGCVAASADLACKTACPEFVGDCGAGDEPADLDGDGCIDGCRPKAEGCEGGTIVLSPNFVPSSDDKQCSLPQRHCVTNDDSSCPQLNPLAPGWCAGTVVAGDPSYVASADGKECEMPNVHCITNDDSSCPQPSPREPGWCADGTVTGGLTQFVPSADGKECQFTASICLTNDPLACPQR